VIDWLILSTPENPEASGDTPSPDGENADDGDETTETEISEEEIA
jgi:hypothetical protein